MSKKILTKLEKYFSRSIKIGALTTAVLMGATACDEPAVEVDPIQAYRESTIDYDKGLESYIFLRHRFAEENDDISYYDSDEKKVAWANKHYEDAKNYFVPKHEALINKILYQEDYNNFLKLSYQKTAEHNKKMNHIEIDAPFDAERIQDITDYMSLTYLPLLGTMCAKLAAIKNTKPYAKVTAGTKFDSHCLALLLRAYNDSLGRDAGATVVHRTSINEVPLPFNQSRKEIDQYVRENTDGAYGLDDYDQIERAVWEMLTTVARETGVELQTLKDVVDINLLHASLRGARDLGSAKADVELSSKSYKVRPSLADYKLTENEYQCCSGSGYDDWIGTYYEEQRQKREQDAALTR